MLDAAVIEYDTSLFGAIRKFGGEPEPESEEPEPEAKPEWRSGARKLGDLMAREFAPLDWVVPGIIPEGTTLLAAPPKAGKSWLALEVALACATGGEALGGIPVGEPRPVLYLDLESGERRLQSRVEKQGWQDYDEFEYELNPKTAMDELRAFLAKHRGHRPLVVLDTLAAVMKDRTREQTQYKADYDALKELQVLTSADAGAAIIVVHHTRKAPSSDPMDDVSGTNGVTGAVDTPIVLRRPDRHSPEGELHVMARDFEGGEFGITLGSNGRWALDGGTLEAAQNAARKAHHERRKSRLGPAKQAILMIVQAASPESVTVAEVESQYVGESVDRVRQNLGELARAGYIDKVERGSYRARADA